ncbi:MAG: NADH-quinone oxidoreductase subunit NuoG [Betaproteobacteria bacterium]
MITIFIDNKPYQVKEGQNLLQACLSLGFDLPYFCWHPAMHSVGACRQCAVKLFRDEKDTRGRIVMSCMTPVAEGLRLSVDDGDARAFRSSVIEWLMLNHPHDCPVCDEGGECHLQDMTVMTGHDYRRTRFRKRTHRNQDLGPFINHEMNRCIQCYRCVRFYRDYAGGRDFHAFACHDAVYFGRDEDGMLESEFSGNLVEVCPTGVFTDKTLKRHYTRKWDLQTAPSVCVHCGIGCNTIPGERYGTLRRILNRYNHAVNGYFLCDRGRFGYEFVNSGRRIRKALLKESGQGVQKPVEKAAALNRIHDILAQSRGIIGIGSPRASLESNFALRTLVGPDNFYSGMSLKEQHLVTMIIEKFTKGPARTPSLHDVETSDAVLVLGEDVTNTAPMLALALRRSVRQKSFEIAGKINVPEWDDSAVRNAAQDKRSPLFIASVAGTRLDDVATRTYHAAPDDIARLGFAVAHELNSEAPAVTGLRETVIKKAKEVAGALKKAKRPLIVAGTSLGSEAIVQAAADVAWALCESGKPAGLCCAVPECNSMGLGLLSGKNLDEAFHAVQNIRADTVIILENDLYRRADQRSVDDFLNKARHVIALDHLINPTSSNVEIALPAGTFAESSGTLVNNEGRCQRFYQVMKPDLDVQESWRWISDIMAASGRKEAPWQNLDDITADITATLPAFTLLQELAPDSDFRIADQKIPRQPHRYSGRTAMLANINIHEPKPPDDPDSPLSFSMEGYEGRPPAPLISRYWSPGWNSVQALNRFQQEVGGPLRNGDPGRRLIEPSVTNKEPCFRNMPEPVKSKENEWLIVPFYHVFGSEELSILSPGIADRAPKPYLALNPDDASRLKVADGGTIELSIADTVHTMGVKVLSEMPRGMAGLYSARNVSLNFVLPNIVEL